MHNDNSPIIELAKNKLFEQENHAPEKYSKFLTMLAAGGVYQTQSSQAAKCDELLALMKAAGKTLEDLRRDWEELTRPAVRKVCIAAGMNFGPSGMQHDAIYLDDLIRDAGGSRIDLSHYTVVRADGQTGDDIKDLLLVVSDFNARTPGKSEEGVKLLRSAKVGGGFFSSVESAKEIAARFPLWKIRLAVVEAGVIKARIPSQKLSELVLRRLGLGSLIEQPKTMLSQMMP